MDPLLIIALLGMLIVLSGTVSGSETALFSINEGQLVELDRETDGISRMVVRLLDSPSRLLLVILSANNAINIAYFALAAQWQAQVHGSAQRAAIMLGSLAALIMAGEILPKVIASSTPVAFARVFAPVITVLSLALRPVCVVLGPVLRFLGGGEIETQSANTVTGDELKLVIEHSREHGVVSELIHDRLQEVVDLSETPVRNVMTHRVDCCSMPADIDREEAIELLRERPAPWILIHNDDEECIGTLCAQDLLRDQRPTKRLRKPLFIPEMISLAQALRLFQASRRTVGVVVDEYGGTAGMLSLAHLGNELLGQGLSEELPEIPEPALIGPNRWRLAGAHPIEGWETLLEDEDMAGCRTVAGFVAKMLGVTPSEGDRLLYRNLLFQVEQVEGQRIRSIVVEKLAHMTARRYTREGRA
ncbi:MAG: hemolysin family protein [Planctomycetota bacterium]